MRDFGTWLNDLANELSKKIYPGLEEAPWGENVQDNNIKFSELRLTTAGTDDFYDEAGWNFTEGHWEAPCRVCEVDSEIFCEPEDFNADEHYCNRSPQCCP